MCTADETSWQAAAAGREHPGWAAPPHAAAARLLAPSRSTRLALFLALLACLGEVGDCNVPRLPARWASLFLAGQR